MKPRIALIIIGLLCVGLLGCATPGHRYEDAKIGMIKKDLTTEAELLQWFGAPCTRTMAPDGSKMLAWKFAPAQGGDARSCGKLDVRLGADGKVVSYSAASGGR